MMSGRRRRRNNADWWYHRRVEHSWTILFEEILRTTATRQGPLWNHLPALMSQVASRYKINTSTDRRLARRNPTSAR